MRSTDMLRFSLSPPLRVNSSRTRLAHLAALATLLLSVLNSALAQTSALQPPAASVDPMIGTGGDPDDGINLFPGATVPFGMVQLSPDTEDHGFGYHYIQKWLKGFSMTHMSGPGCANEGDVFFTATTGPVVTRVDDFESPYSHKLEHAAPGYYEVQLLQWGINAELTATDRTGVARFTFPAGKPANILIPISHTLNNTAAASVRIVDDHRIEGYVENHAFCTNKQTYKVYFVMSFSQPFSSFGTWKGDIDDSHDIVAEGNRAAEQSNHQGWIGAYAGWAPEKHAHSVTVKIGISYVDTTGAENNLRTESESNDFATVRNKAENLWNKELGIVEVAGGTATQRKVFYTALYHSLLMPGIFSDADGRYLGFDRQIHSVGAGRQVYANFSGWDIYRSEIPLLAMLEPQRMQDMAQSVVLMYKQGGWIDRWPQINLYTNDMVGSPLTVALATAWLNGLHGFDIDAAWEGMLKDATQAPPPGLPYIGEQGIDWVNKVHYVPNDKVDYGSVSMTLEYAVAYAAINRLALALGKTNDAQMFYGRALYYRNLLDPEDLFFRPRNADGTWVPGFNPAQNGREFAEGTGWHYLSFAPADLAWLVKTMGRDRFNQRMTEFFDYPVPGWYGQYYNPYNETDLQAPFVFNFSGQPWKTQSAVRRVLQQNYLATPDGVPGNDDCGAMSSWAVLSMMGIYTVDPASLAYELVGPAFPKIVIHLHEPYPGKAFTIEADADSADAPFIQSARLNGRPLEKNWISFHAIAAGGNLHFKLGAKANESWGAAPEDAPPSLSEAH